MAHTVVALYDDFDTARRVVEELVSSGFDRDDISIVANDASGNMSSSIKTSGGKDDVSGGEGAGFGAIVGGLIGLGVALIPGIGPVVAAGPLAAALMAGIGAAAGAATGGIAASLIDLGMSEEEAGYYHEGLRSGGTLVTVNLDDDTHVGRAQDIMNRYNPIDVNERYGGSSMSDSSVSSSGMSTSGMSSTPKQSTMQSGSTTRNVDAGDQVSLPVVEEELQVGKRTVEEGVARVRSYVTETPVEEQVHLREEHVTVERRPVDRPADTTDMNAFREQTIEVTERREEPVVSKQARIVEEVIVGKEVQEHTETIRDTVRRTDVEVENATTSGNMSGVTYRPYTDYETHFRTHYDTNFGTSGYTFDQYTPAYRYGYTLATTDRYRDYDWTRLEPEAQRYWEERNPNTWDRFKDSIQEAWNRVRGR